MSNRALQIINDRLSEIDKEYVALAEAYPDYVASQNRESVGETEGKLSGLNVEKQTLTLIRGSL